MSFRTIFFLLALIVTAQAESCKATDHEEDNGIYEGLANVGVGDYPKVSVANSTPFPVTGEVEYESSVCFSGGQNFNLASHTTWQSTSKRGICLIKKVTATAVTPEGQFIRATAYTSSPATSYHKFAVILNKGNVEVTRVTN